MIDALTMRKILPALANRASIDWSKPMAAWDADTMVSFLMLAAQLIDEVDE
jgi:hypothetical protein